jgi:Flp pilus assembly pilin Flp
MRGVLAGINEMLHMLHIHMVNGSSERRRSIASNQDGQTMAEYAIILGTVALFATAAFMTFGQAIVSMFGPIVSAF